MSHEETQAALENLVRDVARAQRGRPPQVKSRLCPYCNQALPEVRLGVRLTPLKARLFDLVQRGGEDGIPGNDLRDILWPDEQLSVKTLAVHVNQINELIEDEGYRIKGSMSRPSVFRLVKL